MRFAAKVKLWAPSWQGTVNPTARIWQQEFIPNSPLPMSEQDVGDVAGIRIVDSPHGTRRRANGTARSSRDFGIHLVAGSGVPLIDDAGLLLEPQIVSGWTRRPVVVSALAGQLGLRGAPKKVPGVGGNAPSARRASVRE